MHAVRALSVNFPRLPGGSIPHHSSPTVKRCTAFVTLIKSGRTIGFSNKIKKIQSHLFSLKHFIIRNPVFDCIPHRLGVTALRVKSPPLRPGAVITIEEFPKSGGGLFLKNSSEHYFEHCAVTRRLKRALCAE